MSKRVSNKKGEGRKTRARAIPKMSKYDNKYRDKRRQRRLTK